MSERKIFDKEYIYLNNVSNIIIRKIILILTFTITVFFTSLILVYFFNQNLQDEYKWSIEYNEPNPDYNVKKIIKSIDTIERELGYNRGAYNYNPSYLLFQSFYNFLKVRNEKKVFEKKYKSENITNSNTINIKYNFFKLEIFENMQMMLEISINDKEISKDYVKQFKNFYEIEFINQIKEYYPKLINEKFDKLENDLKKELLEAEVILANFIISNQNNQNIEVINTFKQNLTSSIIKKYDMLKIHLDSIKVNIDKEDFKSIFSNSKVSTSSIVLKKQISYIVTGFLSLIIGFFISSLFFIILEYRRNQSKN